MQPEPLGRFVYERQVIASDLSAPTRHVLLTLAIFADWPGGCTPSQYTPSLTRIAESTGLGRSTVARSLAEAEAAGWVGRTRPPVDLARSRKERTTYLLRLPQASPTAGLVPERDQSEASPRAGLVPERDWASPRAGHIPDLYQTEKRARGASPAPGLVAERVVMQATGATMEQARLVVALVQREHAPRNLVGFLRRLATDGDLAARVDQVSNRSNGTVAAAIDVARKGPSCSHLVPGGAELHPVTRKPLCPHCRIATVT